MRRFLLILWLAVGPSLLLAVSGCAQEVRTQSHSERIQQSEPQMVSPGDPILE
ncbi:MAG TPA: hypothetical protein PKG54_19240 [Phycisphaerae bacterium]|jgi:hypothetical protein|nr:hypothetical protein [Phycisphaerae bacterium]HOB76650.1 hypothetical protein [Phycisphaerae bacterium]HOJ56668.1 hypothetical protein [Phycisphaerae bacterium]HOL28453.1 hypothetical protein [Phycisphaerae bacterium]HPP22948.1 hypothetical protein [Phycisphaerae bacterium]